MAPTKNKKTMRDIQKNILLMYFFSFSLKKTLIDKILSQHFFVKKIYQRTIEESEAMQIYKIGVKREKRERERAKGKKVRKSFLLWRALMMNKNRRKES